MKTLTICPPTPVRDFTKKKEVSLLLCFSCVFRRRCERTLGGNSQKEYAARHHCYAYTLHPDKSAWRANDDGEPANTAGKPIWGKYSQRLNNILIVVVRYFGGVKLGVGGLITAYRAAAADALENISIEKRFVKEIYEVAFQYPQMNEVMRLVKDKSLEVVNQDFQIDCKLIFAIRKSQADAVVAAFKKNQN